MMENNDEIEKRYYSIAEVADLLGVNQSVLRFWEKEFDTLTAKKSSSGRRQYTADDVERLKTVHYLLKVKKFTLQGAREALKENKPELHRQRYALETLQEIKDFLVRMRQNL